MTKQRPPLTVIAVALMLIGFVGLLLSSRLDRQPDLPAAGPTSDSAMRATVIARVTSAAGEQTTPVPALASAVPPEATRTPAATFAPAATETIPPTPVVTPTPPAAAQAELAVVSAVLSGDTIEVFRNGQYATVRYLGIDAPDLDEPCGPEAAEANADLVLPLEVRLEPDQTNTDAEGRLLRYVYVGATQVNAALVEAGWAVPSPQPPDTRFAAELAALATPGAGRGCAVLP